MKKQRFDLLSIETAPEGSKPALQQIAQTFGGKIPNLFRMMAYSPHAINGYFQYTSEIEKGTFDFRLAEIIMIASADANECNYCVSAHTALLQRLHYTLEETVQFRTGTHPDPKLNSLARLSKEITKTKGHPAQETLDEFFAQGYDKAALFELIGVIVMNIFNNFTNEIAGSPIDWPLAPNLVEDPLNMA